MRAVKGTEEHDESHVDITRHCGKSEVTMNKVLYRFFLTWKSHAAGSRCGDISSESTDFSSINGPLRAVKGTEERDESHVDFTLLFGKSAIATSKVTHHYFTHLEAPTPLDRGDISCILTDFSSIYRNLRAVKGTEERGKSHVDLTRLYVASPQLQ